MNKSIFSLMSLILMVSLLISMADTMKKTEEKVIFNFADIADKSAWNIVNDGVMGGISNSVFTIDPENQMATFRGRVSLANNGGFASVRTFPNDFQLDGFKGVMLRVKGDGNRYSFRFRVDDNFDGMSYRASFDTQKDTWIDVELPFESFFPTFRGRTLRDVGPLNPADIRQLGLLIGDKQEGKFELTIDWIKAIR